MPPRQEGMKSLKKQQHLNRRLDRRRRRQQRRRRGRRKGDTSKQEGIRVFFYAPRRSVLEYKPPSNTQRTHARIHINNGQSKADPHLSALSFFLSFFKQYLMDQMRRHPVECHLTLGLSTTSLSLSLSTRLTRFQPPHQCQSYDLNDSIS